MAEEEKDRPFILCGSFFILCGSFGTITGNLNEIQTLEEIVEYAKREDPKLYREILRRGWLKSEAGTGDAPSAEP